ncbi:hypothetical protein VTG60DRAFT_3250 [Thermothelomyces hinnuleus]
MRAAIHFPHRQLLETFVPEHITRTSPFPPFSSPWPALEPKQRPRRGFHHRRQMINGPRASSRARAHLESAVASKSSAKPSTPNGIAHVQLQSTRRRLVGIHRIPRRLSRAEVASASNQSNTHSAQTQVQTRSDDGHPLRAVPKAQLASHRLAAAPPNILTRLLSR